MDIYFQIFIVEKYYWFSSVVYIDFSAIIYFFTLATKDLHKEFFIWKYILFKISIF